jgi:magnesium-transporting ATPase (P-type)
MIEEPMKESNEAEKLKTKGLGWRVSLSIIVAIGWLVFLIVWFAFYAGAYSWEKNLAIFLLSILVLIGVLGLPWAIWGMRQMDEEDKKMWKTKGFRGRVWVSCILMLAVFLFLVYWFWFYAETYNVYQNIAIFLVSLLIMGGILGAMWAPWGMKHGSEMKKK